VPVVEWDRKLKKKLALSTKTWKAVFRKMKAHGRAAVGVDEGSSWIIVGAHFVFALVLSLRGPEAFMFKIGLLSAHKELKNDLVWSLIVGKLKGDSREET